MGGLTNLRRCHICQEYGDHWTPRCPKLICAECDEKGHSKLVCPYLLDEYVALMDSEETAEPDSDQDLINEKEKEDEAQAEAVVEAVSAGFSPWWWVLGFFILVVFVLFMFFMRNAMVWGQGRHARR